MKSYYPFRIPVMIGICILVLLVFSQVAIAGSEAKHAAYAAGDIQFCPKGKPYLHDSCSPVRTSMITAIEDAKTAAAAGVSGTIYLEGGSYGGGSLTVSGFTYGTSLTIQGGVNGGTTIFTRELNVIGNDLDFTLQDVTLNHSAASENGFSALSNTGDLTLQSVYANVGDGHGISVYNQTGDIYMINIYSNNNDDTGILLWTINGDVELYSVNANGNGYANLYIDTVSGSLNMDDITVSSSVDFYGIFITDITGKKGVIMSNVSTISNGWTNLYIQNVLYNVSLTNVQAHNSSGINDNFGIRITHIYGTKGVTLNQVSAHSNTDGNITIGGIDGSVSLTDIEADSGYFGIFCSMIDGSKGVTMKNVTANSNTWENVSVYDISGNVKMTDITAGSSVNDRGVYIKEIDGSKGVNLNRIYANGNYLSNIQIDDILGSVTLNTVEASASVASLGVHVEDVKGSKGVTVKNAIAHGNQSKNFHVEYIDANVSISGIAADGSLSGGVEVMDIAGSKGVTLKDITATGNTGDNVYVNNITGNVTISNTAATGSLASSGVWLEDIYGTKGATLKNISSTGNNNIDVVVNNVVNGNVSLSGVEASGSGNNGIRIDTVLGPKGVTLKNITSNDHTQQNIIVTTIVGNASMSNVVANGSITSGGIQVTNVTGSKGVSLKGIEANNNHDHNIFVSGVSYDVSMSKIQAEQGDSVGISIQNVDGYKGVSLKDVIANINAATNIYIYDVDPGDVVLNKVTANDSISDDGLWISAVVGEVMAQNSSFNNNDANGVHTEKIDGLVLLKKIEGNDSVNDNGAYLESSNYQLICSSTFINNAGYGVYGDTSGYSLTIAATDLDSIANGIDPAGASPGTTLWDNWSSKCVVIPPL